MLEKNNPAESPKAEAPQSPCEHDWHEHCDTDINAAGVHREYWRECKKCGETQGDEGESIQTPVAYGFSEVQLQRTIPSAPVEAPRVEGELPPLDEQKRYWNLRSEYTLLRLQLEEAYACQQRQADEYAAMCIAKQSSQAEVERLKERLAVMTEDRNLWQGEHNEDCPNLAEVDRLRAEIAELKEKK